MPSLEVRGATLHYESFGTGPLLLLIPGAQGTGAIFYDVAKLLSPSFTVICLTRRGYSQSLLTGSQDFNNRLSIDADDAHLLIQELSAEPIMVLGSSSGAVVAQRLLERHPESVKKLISHEPPSISLLPLETRIQAVGAFDHVYNAYRANGTIPAMEFFASVFNENDAVVLQSAMDSTRGDEIRANTMFWLEFELRQYTSAPVNLDLLVAEKEKFIPVAGALTKGGPCFEPISLIAQKMGKEVLTLPGAHVGYATETKAFAEGILDLLK